MAFISEEQSDELEALRSIYGEYFTDINNQPPCFIIKVTKDSLQLKAPLNLKVTFTQTYPQAPPILEIPNRSQILSSQQTEDLLSHLKSAAEVNVGMAMVFTLVESMKEWLVDKQHTLLPESEPIQRDEPKEDDRVPVPTIHLEEPQVTGGKWDLVIGLVGKPSAGKSTFFNAATALEMAKVGAHPFTTIEPNIGKAYYSIPCPCTEHDQPCDAAYGHNHRGERLMPVLLKDVAGLVPGACDGKGRGNRFLNDLCDAHVLMHIVDVSGTTNEKGEETTGYDPTLDVTWLQQEIHRWIFDNVMDKWDAVKRKASKLVDMFTGYHASRATIFQVLQAVGIGDLELSNISNWSEDIVHRIVSQFIATRFPTYLVLNKADAPTAPDNIHKVRLKFYDVPYLPVSAKCETTLQRYHRQRVIQYAYGASQCELRDNFNASLDGSQLEYIEQHVWNRFKSTNVHRALSEAVALRKPVYAFPVQDLDTLHSIDKYKGEEAGVLRDAVCLKPTTTCEELYTAMLHYPIHLCAGDFIRAECLTETGEKRIMKKSERIGEHREHSWTILKVMTNRKVTPIKRR